jgi:hypothetical protein
MHRRVAALAISRQYSLACGARGCAKQWQLKPDNPQGVRVGCLKVGQICLEDAAVRAIEIRKNRDRNARISRLPEQRQTRICAHAGYMGGVVFIKDIRFLEPSQNGIWTRNSPFADKFAERRQAIQITIDQPFWPHLCNAGGAVNPASDGGQPECQKCAPSRRGRCFTHSLTRLRRSALEITDTEDRLIAAAAIIGDSNSPVTG